MLLCTTWKSRPLDPETAERSMAVWGKIEADMAEHPGVERLCWYMFSDGSGGLTVNRFDDDDDARAFGLEISMALGSFIELESRPVLDLETAMPAIMNAMERMKG